MKHKTIARIAIGMIVVVLATVLLYPMMFNPDSKLTATTEMPPTSDGKPVTPGKIKTH